MSAASPLHPLFAEILQPVTPPAAPATNTQNPFEIFHARLLARLALVVRPRNPGSFWDATDFAAAVQYVRDVVEIADDWIAEIGSEVADNSHNSVDLRSFDQPFLCAVDGNATFEIENAGERA